MRDGWLNEFLARIDREDSYKKLNTKTGDSEENQSLLDKGEGVSIFKSIENRIVRWLHGDEDLDDHERWERLCRDLLDDDWLIDKLLEHPEIVVDLLIKEQLYLPLEGTAHLADFHYKMEHSN